MIAIPIVIIAEEVVLSRKKINPPSRDTIGCSAKIIVELATVVNLRELNQRAKWNAKKEPEKNKNAQSLLDSFLKSFLCIYTMGIIIRHASHIRYILKMVAGASDHFTKIAENEMAIIETSNGSPIDFDDDC